VRIESHRHRDRGEFVNGRLGGAVEVPELLPQLVHVAHRVVHRDLENNTTTRMVIQRLQERHDVADVVRNVMTHHNVGFGNVVSHVGPITEKLPVLNSAFNGSSREDIEHSLLMVDGNHFSCGWHESERCTATATADVEDAAAFR
jgi:hypothetical protein